MTVFSRTGFTLIELIVAAALVGVVLLGIISVNMTLDSNNQDYSQKYFLKSETQTTLNHILKNASLAIGNSTVNSAGYSEKGIFIGAGPGCGDLGCGDPTNNPNTFCIHQDITPGPYAAPTTIDSAPINPVASSPPDYSNSRWLCYTYYGPAAATPNQIFYCTMPYNVTLAANGAGSCHGVANALYLGTAMSISYLSGVVTNPIFSATVGGQPVTNTFSITIQNCYNDSMASCNGTGTGSGVSSDPVGNPEVQLSGSVTPGEEGS